MNTIEHLERRIMMIATNLVGNVLYIGTGGTSDVISGNVSGGGTLSIFVTVGGVPDPAFVMDKFQYTNVVSFNISTAGGADSITLQNIAKPSYIGSGSGNDTVTGGFGNDTIEAGDGNDSIDGSQGNDLIDGGALADTLIGGIGNDTLNYSGRSTAVVADLDNAPAGDDGATGENDKTSAFESLMGGGGADSLTGDALGNYISGGAGNDTIKGGAGNDIEVGGAGQDSILGEADNDAIFALDGEIDYIDGGAGTDSCQSDPAEQAPLPPDPGSATVAAAPARSVETAIPAAATVARVAQAKATFSVTRISKTRARLRRVAAVFPPLQPTTALARSSGPTTNLKGGPSNLEFDGDGKQDPDASGLPEEDPVSIQQLGQELEPYAFGQVNTSRNYHGVVMVNGTPGDDVFVVTTKQGTAGVRISNNGGETEYLLQSDPININGMGGNDTVIIAGGGGSTVNYAPAGQPGVPTHFTSDGHTINVFGSAGGTGGSVGFSNVATVNYVTPNSQDSVQITNLTGQNGGFGNGPIGPDVQVDATSGGLALPTLFLSGVGVFNLDTGTNDNAAGGPSDQVAFLGAGAAGGGSAPVAVALNLGSMGQDSVIVNAGAVTLTNDPSPDPASPATTNVVVAPGASLAFDSAQTHLSALNLPGGNATINPGGDKVLFLRGLGISQGGRLDVTDNSLVIDHPPGAPTPYYDLVSIGYQPAAPTHWNGNGITSSLAALDPGKAVGIAESFRLFGPNGGFFRGQQVDGSSTLISYTLNGDANLDRKVGFGDLVAVAQHYETPETADWLAGDFNFDGQVNFPDLVAVAQNYDGVF